MVRPGISLYGYYPSLETTESVKLKLVMELVSKIESIKKINKGESVSYGRKFIAKKDTIIATVPIGYADGYNRNLTNRSIAYCKKNILSQAGRVCMDRIMFEIDDKNIKAGDEIILLGRNNFFNFDAWEWSKILNTIPYEILCCIGKRVRREYL
jgi:alanine racemase